MNRTYKLIETEKELERLSKKLLGKEQIAFDWETTGVKFWEDEFLPLGLALAYDDSGGWYIPMNHRLPNEGSLFNFDGTVSSGKQPPRISLEALKKYIYPVLLCSNMLVAHNFKFDAQVNERFGMPLWSVLQDDRVYDTYIAAALTNDTRSDVSLKKLSKEWLGIDATEIEELASNADLTEVPLELVSQYAIDDACNTLALKAFTEKKLNKSKKLSHLFWNLEMPIIEAVAQMEATGIKIDKKKLREVDRWARHFAKCALNKLQYVSGFPFDPGKTEHTTAVLYDELGLPPSRSKGKDNTDRKQIKIHFDLLPPERKKQLAPFVKPYLAYKDSLKIYTTYAQPGIDLSYKSRIHPSFLQCNVVSGRFASRNPNLQNQPKVGGHIDARKGLVPDKEHILMLCDYQRMEFLIVSAMSEDPFLVEAARDPEMDIHSHTARGVFDLAPDATPTKEQRDKAKTTVYGILYGVTKEGLAKQLSVSVPEAARIIKKFYETYYGLKQWQDIVTEFIMSRGYSQTYFGRRRYADREKLLEGDKFAKERELRQLINHIIQGGSADVVKIAMKKCYKALQEKKLRTKLVGQIHDELIFLTPYEEIATVIDIVNENMPFTLFPEKENEVTLGIDIEIKNSMSKSKDAHVSKEFLEKWAPNFVA